MNDIRYDRYVLADENEGSDYSSLIDLVKCWKNYNKMLDKNQLQDIIIQHDKKVIIVKTGNKHTSDKKEVLIYREVKQKHE